MAGEAPQLVLVHETEEGCARSLRQSGFAPARIAEVTSYLAQSTDLAREFDDIAAACDRRGIGFMPVELDDAPSVLPRLYPKRTLVWTLTDGIAYFRGGASPALARLCRLPAFGADDSIFALCQDKFRSGAVLGALGLPVPPSGLARNGLWLVQPPDSDAGWFVKPNRLGAKIGIWPDSHCTTPDAALDLSRRILDAYLDDAVVQAYVPGRNARASFLALHPQAGVDRIGLDFVGSGGDFQTMDDSLALYGATGEQAKAGGSYDEPLLAEVAACQPVADRRVRDIAARSMRGLGLRDVYSIDLRIEPDDTVHLIEFEVCPGLPCFDFRAYCRTTWGRGLADAMAETAARRLLAAS